mmetsp:Transcript_7164/g.10970  ORF Transcript_7164/g.10970 Transcript_7164/m.10970 type:complete len:218 (+) Transcript_7164:202-855(+)
MQACNLLIKSLWQNVNFALSVLARVLFLPEFELSQYLVSERSRHHERRVASSTSQVKKTSFGENNNSVARFEFESVDLWLDVDSLGGLHQSVHINFVIEMSNVSNNSVIFHLAHSVGHENTLVTSGGDENVGGGNDILECYDCVSFHACLESTDRINFSYVHDHTACTECSSASLANVSVSADDSLLSSHHDISCAHDTVWKRVLASVQVIELGFGY